MVVYTLGPVLGALLAGFLYFYIMIQPGRRPVGPGPVG